MGSYSSGIADAIRQMGNAGARNEMNKGQIYGNLAQQLGNAPQQYLGIQQGLQENRHRNLLMQEQEKTINQEHELEALLGTLKTPEERWSAARNYWGVHDPEKANQMDQLAFRAVKTAYDTVSGQPGRNPVQAGVEGQLPANAMAPVTPLEQQEVPNQPMHFPSVAGQPAFDATPPTQAQKLDSTGIAAYIKSLGTSQGKVEGSVNKMTMGRPGATPMNQRGEQIGATLPGMPLDPNIALNEEKKRLQTQGFQSSEGDKRDAARIKAAKLGANVKVQQNATEDEVVPVSNAILSQLAGGLGVNSLKSRVQRHIAANNPEFNWAKAESGMTAGNRNQKVIRSIDAADAGLNTVLETSKAFSRSEVGLLNSIILKGEVQVNNPNAIRFQTAINSVIDDVASVLSGGGATTDQARNQATKIFHEAYSQNGLDAAVGALREILTTRRAAFSAGTPYEKKGDSGGANGPSVGTVQKGYRFKGGDPASAQSWEKVQ